MGPARGGQNAPRGGPLIHVKTADPALGHPHAAAEQADASIETFHGTPVETGPQRRFVSGMAVAVIVWTKFQAIARTRRSSTRRAPDRQASARPGVSAQRGQVGTASGLPAPADWHAPKSRRRRRFRRVPCRRPPPGLRGAHPQHLAKGRISHDPPLFPPRDGRHLEPRNQVPHLVRDRGPCLRRHGRAGGDPERKRRGRLERTWSSTSPASTRSRR